MGKFVLNMGHLQFTDLIHVAATSWITVKSFAKIECPVKAQNCNTSDPFCALAHVASNNIFHQRENLDNVDECHN